MTLNRRSVLAGALGGLMVPTLASRVLAHDKHFKIAIRDFEFEAPDGLIVHPTDRITFTNHDLSPHTATASDGSWDTGELKKGESITLTVTEDWNSDYFCAFHPTMTAKLMIEAL